MGRAFKILPKNYLEEWGEFETWAEGTSSAPSGWLSASSPFLLSREATNIKFGSYAALLVGSAALGSSAAGVAGIYRTVPNGSDYQGRTFSFGIWAKSASTGPYVEINDGVASKTVHLDGLNAYYFLTTPPMKIDVSATQIRLNLFATKASTVYFDGAVLCEGEDLYTNFNTNIDISGWSPSLNYKQDEYEVSQSEGDTVSEIHRKARTHKLTGQVVGSDVNSTRSNFDALLESLVSWQPNEKRNLFLYDDRVMEVFLRNIDHNYKNGLQFIPFSLNFIVPDGTSRTNARYRSRTVIAASVTEFNLPYTGNAESKPKISFIANQGGAITTCTLTNLTTGETMTYFGTVPTGVALDIDCAAGTVFNSSVNKISDWGTSDFPKLVRGTNYFRFQGSNCTINIDYYERFTS
jgi:phage-related protein